MRAFLLVPVAFVAAVSAVGLEQRSPFHEIRSSLVARSQILDPNIIPDQCKNACSPAVDSLNSCTSADCLCTNDNGKKLKQCADCLAKLGNSPATTSSSQSILDSFVSSCKAAGKDVDSMTVSTSNSGSTLHIVANGGVLAAGLVGVVAYLF